MENHFDNVARDWDKQSIHIQRTEAIANALREELQKKKINHALEFGAGTGLLSFALQDFFSEIILMDSSAEMILATKDKIAGSGLTHLHPIQFDLELNNYSVKTFDIIFSQMALHHVNDIEKIIAKFYNLLNAGGKLAIADLYKENGTFHEKKMKVHYGFDPEELKAILIKYGFRFVISRQCFVIERKVDNEATKSFPVFLLTCEK